ncbi:hypothetical protein CDQ84_14640 [Clostridium thermosuccinogenes]|jgi:RNA polymerase sigma-70 factor (ECF subfamily)|uniref:RNA polymerase sigma factor n=1 Tax=Clostridium thermosuccinogenes TaxID=84032 RepID=A0A2K2F9T4_9CLOT|nr:RNA polymerase sigma factor [Pseudoclostridium thermosuccinogenes]AUS97132.1 hypothetical protein CDO33_12190 [Pseudoclostridium thermosuccinogenes]PNT92192.1 hypothetical protein CDQ83_01035 [Pseudoclostridium thermosuccinogenes]PNT95562.1 hypothetical protein CDQ85_14505 [Pseudoclostridium thermosuccinogenes]PNT96723.1 hypothetical protein CDQ84_14640 [Pseudoclostridium thermosuccinogenes]
MNEVLLDNLIQRISSGDRSALGELYNITSNDVYGYALSIVCSKSMAEDIMHDVYIQIFNSAKTYKSQGKAMAWILRITRNMSYNRLKKMKHESMSIDQPFDNEAYQAFDDNAVLDRLILDNLLTKLSIGERQVVMLYLLSGISQKDISNITGVPLPTVKWRYKSALKKLSKTINSDIAGCCYEL